VNALKSTGRHANVFKSKLKCDKALEGATRIQKHLKALNDNFFKPF
jgi:hypothetical protein